VLLFAQQTDSVFAKKDSGDKVILPSSAVKEDSALFAKWPDTAVAKHDSAVLARKDTVISRSATYLARVQKIVKANRFLNSAGPPLAIKSRVKKSHDADNFFYLLAFIALLLGSFRFFYTRYFNNLFRVFFNASLRQSQLTDQLLQAKLPSLFFNIVFVLTGGFYIYLLLMYYHWISPGNFWLVLLYCTLSLAAIYVIKYITVKFTGWLTGYKDVTNTYVFIIFLINKILGVLLLPFTVIIAFAIPAIATGAIIISLLLIGLMILLRFFRSYGLLEHKLKISRFHFLMYVAGIEILPVLLIYKGLILLLGKNL